jgi:hypothetical protein
VATHGLLQCRAGVRANLPQALGHGGMPCTAALCDGEAAQSHTCFIKVAASPNEALDGCFGLLGSDSAPDLHAAARAAACGVRIGRPSGSHLPRGVLAARPYRTRRPILACLL